jgi:hypothetical protein
MAIWLLSIQIQAPNPAFAMTTIQGTFTTQREYIEKLTEQVDPCKGCHSQFNPLGYLMENYDGTGKWQTKDPLGGDINTSVTFDFGQGAKPFSSPVELTNAIADSANAKSLYAQAWVAFARGRLPNANDKCTVDQLSSKLVAGGYSILNLLGDLTQTDDFRLRVRGTL